MDDLIGMGYTIDIHAAMGQRISDMTLLKTGKPIDPARAYIVTGWASVNETTKGPPIWEVLGGYLARNKTVRVTPNDTIKVVAS